MRQRQPVPFIDNQVVFASSFDYRHVTCDVHDSDEIPKGHFFLFRIWSVNKIFVLQSVVNRHFYEILVGDPDVGIFRSLKL